MGTLPVAVAEVETMVVVLVVLAEVGLVALHLPQGLLLLQIQDQAVVAEAVVPNGEQVVMVGQV